MCFAPLFAAALSEATLLTVGQMGQAPKFPIGRFGHRFVRVIRK